MKQILSRGLIKSYENKQILSRGLLMSYENKQISFVNKFSMKMH